MEFQFADWLGDTYIRLNRPSVEAFDSMLKKAGAEKISLTWNDKAT
jgi:hypothetical protein